MTEIGYRPSWSFYLTLGQTLQMVIGTVINVAWFIGFMRSDEYGCVCERGCGKMFMGIGLMYITYFVLFTKFFFEKYGSSKKDDGSKGKDLSKGSETQRKKSKKLE